MNWRAMNRVGRVVVHGFALVLADLAGVASGAVLAHAVLGTANQVWLQLPIAVAATIALWFAWMSTVRWLQLARLRPAGADELFGWIGGSILWGAVILVPLHYLTQGYLTGLGNLVALALYQLPVNAVSVFGWTALAEPGPDRRSAAKPTE